MDICLPSLRLLLGRRKEEQQTEVRIYFSSLRLFLGRRKILRLYRADAIDMA